MPQIVVLAAGMATLFYGVRWFRAETRRVEAALKRTQRRINDANRAPFAAPLALDITSGAYTPIQAQKVA